MSHLVEGDGGLGTVEWFEADRDSGLFQAPAAHTFEQFSVREKGWVQQRKEEFGLIDLIDELKGHGLVIFQVGFQQIPQHMGVWIVKGAEQRHEADFRFAENGRVGTIDQGNNVVH